MTTELVQNNTDEKELQNKSDNNKEILLKQAISHLIYKDKKEINAISKKDMKDLLSKHLSELLEDEEYSNCFTIDQIARICIHNFPNKYCNPGISKALQDLVRNVERKFDSIRDNDIVNCILGKIKLTSDDVDKVLDFLENRLNSEEKSENVHNLLYKIIYHNDGYLKAEKFEQCIKILIKNAHKNFIKDLCRIYEKYSKIENNPDQQAIKKLNKFLEKTGISLKEQSDKYYDILKYSLDDISGYSNDQLFHIKTFFDILIKLFPEDTMLKDEIENLFLKVISTSCFDNGCSDSEIKTFSNIFEMGIKYCSQDKSKKDLIDNFNKMQIAFNKSKLENFKKILKGKIYTETQVDFSIKTYTADKLIELYDSEGLNDSDKDEIIDVLSTYISEVGKDELLDKFFKENKSHEKIVKRIIDLENLSTDKRFKLKSLFCCVFVDNSDMFDDGNRNNCLDILIRNYNTDKNNILDILLEITSSNEVDEIIKLKIRNDFLQSSLIDKKNFFELIKAKESEIPECFFDELINLENFELDKYLIEKHKDSCKSRMKAYIRGNNKKLSESQICDLQKLIDE